MRTLASLIITAALALGVLAGATAYLARLNLPDQLLIGQTLAAPAGAVSPAGGPAAAIARAQEQITPELLAQLREAGVERVRLKDFAMARWEGRWPFAMALMGLGLGAWLVRSSSRRAIATGVVADDSADAAQAVASIREAVAGLRRDLTSAHDDRERAKLITARLSQVQRVHVDAVLQARPVLIGRLGLSRFAAFMDRFSAAERLVNRAWSAAVDGYLGESLECIDRAGPAIEEAAQRLRA